MELFSKELLLLFIFSFFILFVVVLLLSFSIILFSQLLLLFLLSLIPPKLLLFVLLSSELFWGILLLLFVGILFPTLDSKFISWLIFDDWSFSCCLIIFEILFWIFSFFWEFFVSLDKLFPWLKKLFSAALPFLPVISLVNFFSLFWPSFKEFILSISISFSFCSFSSSSSLSSSSLSLSSSSLSSLNLSSLSSSSNLSFIKILLFWLKFIFFAILNPSLSNFGSFGFFWEFWFWLLEDSLIESEPGLYFMISSKTSLGCDIIDINKIK